MIPFLIERQFQYQRAKLKIDVYLSGYEAKEYQRLAKEIDPQRYFTVYSCNDCIKTLIIFVFENYGKKTKTTSTSRTTEENNQSGTHVTTVQSIQTDDKE